MTGIAPSSPPVHHLWPMGHFGSMKTRDATESPVRLWDDAGDAGEWSLSSLMHTGSLTVKNQLVE